MTVELFNEIVNNARRKGKLISSETRVPPFGLEEEVFETYEFRGYKVYFQDNSFLSLVDENNLQIKLEDCTLFDFDNMSDAQLEAMMKDAQKTIKARQQKEAKKAIEDFNRAWLKLKEFGEVRLRVSATGESHFHSTVDRVKIEVLPLH